MTKEQLADMIETLSKSYTDPWVVEKEPHDIKDGTDHFNHVTFYCSSIQCNVSVATYVTDELADLLVTLHNNLPTIVEALRKNS